MTQELRAEVAIVGGGIAGLWTLASLRAKGVDAILLEAHTLGSGQTLQAQGIVHGGGKYALRSVGDRAAIEAIREMPTRWREHFAGTRRPSLAPAKLLSDRCWLWLPREQWRARWEAWSLMPMLRHGGILHCPPQKVDRREWPEVLAQSALRAFAMSEPVFSTASVHQALAEPLRDHLFHFARSCEGQAPELEQDGRWKAIVVEGPGEHGVLRVQARAFVLTAGAGNAEWIERAGGQRSLMQRRSLRMFLLRGALPPLHGHCFLGGRTRMTITSHDLEGGRRVWQIGGEVAERHAGTSDLARAYADAQRELRTVLPHLDIEGLQWSSYEAIRAERSHPGGRRPEGVQVERIAPNAWAAWPTKWALAPVLAEEIEKRLPKAGEGLASPAAALRPRNWARPQVGRPPWEEDLPWIDVRSVGRD